MSWHYLQGQEAASWEGSSLDGAPSALSKLIPTPAASCSQDKPTDASNRSPFGMTLRRSTGTDGAEALTWFRGDSPVRTYRQQAKEQDSTASDLDCGPRWPGSLARCSPPLSGWKTRQCSLFGGLTEFSGTWPRWGMMQDGESFPLATPAHLISGNESGFWPTPKASDFKVDVNDSGEYARRTVAAGFQDALPFWIKRRWPGRRGVTNLDFVDWLMGWPIGWSALAQSATDRFRQWLHSHGGC